MSVLKLQSSFATEKIYINLKCNNIGKKIDLFLSSYFPRIKIFIQYIKSLGCATGS